MRVNYLIVLIIAIIIYLVLEIKGNKKLKLKDIPILVLFVGGPIGLVCCAVLYIFSSTVCKVNPDGSYTDHDYIFYYKSDNSGTNGIIPFNYYVDNVSDREIVYTEVGYGSHKFDTFETTIIPNKSFADIPSTPDFMFRKVPSSVRVKGSGAIRSVLYFEDEGFD